MKATKNAHLVDEPAEGQETVNLHIDNMPDSGGGDPVTVDTLQGATETGKSLMKATDAAAARAAIGAGTSNFSGSYNDLSDKPTVPGAAAAVADVSATDAAPAASETVTKAEFDAVVTLANGLKATLNALLAACRAAGQLQS